MLESLAGGGKKGFTKKNNAIAKVPRNLADAGGGSFPSGREKLDFKSSLQVLDQLPNRAT